MLPVTQVNSLITEFSEIYQYAQIIVGNIHVYVFVIKQLIDISYLYIY